MTNIVDTFDRADNSGGAGTTSDGNGTWVDLYGTSGISSNKGFFAHVDGGFPPGASTVDPGIADGTLTVDISANNTTGDDAGVVFRVVDANNYWLVQASGALWKCVAGSLSLIAGFADNVNGTLSVALSGSSIIVKWNGTTLTTQTDAFNSTATKHGIYANTSAPRFDNWSVSGASPAVAISGTSARTRSASAAIAVDDGHVGGVSHRARTATASIATNLPLTASSSEGWEFNGRTRDATATIDVDEPVAPLPTGTHLIATQWSEITDAPALVDGKVDAAGWRAATVERHGVWGRYRIVVNGKDVTSVGGVLTVVLQDSDTEPFGDDVFTVVFPAVSPFDELGVGDLAFLPNDDGKAVHVRAEKIDPFGGRYDHWEGDCDVLTDTFDGQVPQLQVSFLGLVKTLDGRITKPRFTSDPVDIGQFIHDLVAHEAKYGWAGHAPAVVQTGTTTAERGGYGDALATVTIQNLLAEDGRYTIKNNRPRGMKLVVKDRTTVHFTLWCGQPGVTHTLTRDRKHAIAAIFGEGQDGGTQFWRNTQYPNAPLSPPAYPLPSGQFFTPGSTYTGFSPFSDELRTRGYSLASRDTYLSSDENIIRDFQDDAGILIDGVVGGQTWNAAFTTGLSAHALDAYIRPLTVVSAAEPFLYNSRGGIIGKNPSYHGRPRNEKLEQFGTLPKSAAKSSAKAELAIVKDSDWFGTITATNVDPPEVWALDTRAGMNMLFRNHRGADRLLHIAKADRDPGMAAGHDRVVTWTTSERGDDYVTIAARMQHKKDVVDQSGRTRAPRRGAKISPDYAPWDSESGAGFLSPRAQTAGLWNVYPVPAGERGTITHVRLLADTPCLISAAVFNKRISAEQLTRLPGLADPSSGAAGGVDPWQVSAAYLTQLLTYADQPWMAWATGGPGAMQGYWPNTPDVGATLTGILDDAASFPFHSAHGVWLFLAVWTSATCRVSGDPAYNYRALFPGADT